MLLSGYSHLMLAGVAAATVGLLTLATLHAVLVALSAVAVLTVTVAILTVTVALSAITKGHLIYQ
jgi:hypothetical protein